MNNKRVLRFIDLFCGAGGLAQGFRQASDKTTEFRPVFAVEIEPAFAASYAANFGDHVFAGPIEDVRRDDLPEAELVVGGPPCQGFSNLGKVSPTEEHAQLNKLWRHYFNILGWVRPLAFVVENVPEFLSSPEFDAALRNANKLGYSTDHGILNAGDFGVPQLRRRGFLIGIRNATASLPVPTTARGKFTVASAIKDIAREPLIFDFRNGHRGHYPPHDASELHIGRHPTSKSLERYKTIPPGGNRFTLMKLRPDLTPGCWFRKKSGATDVMGRLEWEKPSVTIRTEFFKPEKGRYLHPEHDRPITHWEAARIQTFPDDFKFCGSKTDIARQIGNAVPPRLAEAIARHVKDLLAQGERSLAPPRQTNSARA